MAQKKKFDTIKTSTTKTTEETTVSHEYGQYKPDKESLQGALSHLLAIFTFFVGPLIMFVVLYSKQNRAYDNARNAFNFEISLLIYYAVATLLLFVWVGFALIPLFWIVSLIFEIIGVFKAYYGGVYQYPFTIEFVK